MDRRRLKRRLVFWRVFGVASAVAAALLVLGSGGAAHLGPHVARVTVAGLITEDRSLTEDIDRLADDASVKAVILSIDSPGGSVAGGTDLHDAIGRVAEKKPVVTVMGAVAASAGYMIAVPTSRIFARAATLTGSIGVLLETGEVSGLLDKLGIKADVVRSGLLKDEPGLTHPLSTAGRAVLQALVDDMYQQFVAMVATGRHMSLEQVLPLSDGRAYTGRQALAMNLVDAIGGEREARQWLASEKGVPETLPVEDVPTKGFASKALTGRFLGSVPSIWKALISQGVSLDGAWAVWHP